MDEYTKVMYDPTDHGVPRMDSPWIANIKQVEPPLLIHSNLLLNG